MVKVKNADIFRLIDIINIYFYSVFIFFVGIVLAAEKRVVSKLLAPSKTSEKTYPIDNHICCLVAGFSSDANTLIQEARVGAQRSAIYIIY